MESSPEELDLIFARAVEATSDTDLVAVETLTSIIRTNKQLATRLSEKIGERLHSAYPSEVHQAINILEACMNDSNELFRSDIGRFRFLNEIVRLVTPERPHPPPSAIRNRLMDLMLVWTCQYPQLSKIKEAYSMLRKKGVPHIPAQDHRLEQRLVADVQTKQRPLSEATMFDEIPKHLLTSTNPSDVQAAKLMIEKALAKEKRHQEVRLKYTAELKAANEIATLMAQLIEAQPPGGPADDETTGLMIDLFGQCRAKQIIVSRYASGAHNPEWEEALLTNDLLHDVMQRYLKLVTKEINPSGKTSTNVLIPNHPASMSPNTELLTAIMNSAAPVMLPTTPPPLNIPLSDPLAGDLDDIFLQPIGGRSAQNARSFATSDADDLLLLVSPSSSSVQDAVQQHRTTSEAATNGQVLQPNLLAKGVVTNGAKAETKPVASTDFFNLDSTISGLKISLAQKEQSIGDRRSSDHLPLDNVITSAAPPDDDDCSLFMGAAASEPPPLEQPIAAPVKPMRETPLSELVIDLDHIQPSDHPSKVIMDDAHGLKVVLHFAQDRPRADVSVIVIVTTNQSAEPVTNYVLDASVSKPNKVRLLAASGRELPRKKPFRPPTEDITQVLLVAHKSAAAAAAPPPRITCIVSYVLGDDPDPIKECVTIDDLPPLAVLPTL